MGSLLQNKLTWEHAEAMIKYWGGPFSIKGIMSAADAIRAAEIGASAIIISNHGGRQCDNLPAPIEMLAEIRAAVGDSLEIIVDGGITRVSDIVKALALNANACPIGKAYVAGLGSGGLQGAERCLEILRAEVEREMALIGCASISDLTPDLIRDTQVPCHRQIPRRQCCPNLALDCPL
jgi:L-lactate dehydrogenase (cytochrome)